MATRTQPKTVCQLTFKTLRGRPDEQPETGYVGEDKERQRRREYADRSFAM